MVGLGNALAARDDPIRAAPSARAASSAGPWRANKSTAPSTVSRRTGSCAWRDVVTTRRRPVQRRAGAWSTKRLGPRVSSWRGFRQVHAGIGACGTLTGTAEAAAPGQSELGDGRGSGGVGARRATARMLGGQLLHGQDPDTLVVECGDRHGEDEGEREDKTPTGWQTLRLLRPRRAAVAAVGLIHVDLLSVVIRVMMMIRHPPRSQEQQQGNHDATAPTTPAEKNHCAEECPRRLRKSTAFAQAER